MTSLVRPPSGRRLAATLLLGLAGWSAIGLPAAGAAGGRTQVRVYDPVTNAGVLASGLKVTRHLHGTCSGGGVAGGSSYRCIATSGGIEDPCFGAGPNGPFYCPASPTGRDVSEVATASAAPATPIEPAREVWAIELADGQVCKKVNAAWSGLGPMTCSPVHVGAVADCRLPVEGDPWWSASCQATLSATAPFTRHRVRAVWR